jgi:uncharacterized membrane protein YcjF (UPF0283 family)
MKKNFLQDVVPSSQKRSIRDVPLPAHKEPQIKRREVRTKIKEERVEEDAYEQIFPIQEDVAEEQDDQDEQEYIEIKKKPAYKKTKTTFMKKIIIGLAIGVLIFIGVFISRTDAKITITPTKYKSYCSA